MKEKSHIEIVYDGECPFCVAYTKMLRLQETYKVELINARDDHPLVKELIEKEYDLDEGMVVKNGDQYHHGADAMFRLSLMSNKSGALRRFSNWVFANERRSQILYPFLRGGRNATLWVLGHKKINAPNQ